MNVVSRSLALAAALCAGVALAQVPVTANPDHERMLASTDARLAANKRLVYDFYREVFEGGQMDAVGKYLSEGYIQHNPLVPTGRAGFVAAFGPRAKPQPVEARMKSPVVAISAEGDLVVISFVREYPEPGNAAQKYTTTWFDMFRIEGGKIVEHWDGATKR